MKLLALSFCKQGEEAKRGCLSLSYYPFATGGLAEGDAQKKKTTPPKFLDRKEIAFRDFHRSCDSV